MARDGARLTSFYAAAPICTPTRAALMTGCYATRVGLPTPLHVYDKIGLNTAEITLPEVLQQQRYRTACVGKWHLGHVPEFYPTRHGFDVYWGTPLGHMFNRPDVGKSKGDASDLFLNGEKPVPFPANEDVTERLTDAAVKFIDQNKGHPFFLFLSHTMPHEPLAVSKRFAGQSKGGLYGDVIECIDRSTGRILAALNRHVNPIRHCLIMSSSISFATARRTRLPSLFKPAKMSPAPLLREPDEFSISVLSWIGFSETTASSVRVRYWNSPNSRLVIGTI